MTTLGVARWALRVTASLTLASGCGWMRQAPVSGTVNVAPALLGKAQQPGSVLFIVARNRGDVPVAVREIVNPSFPCRFTIGAEDLILPGAWGGGLRLSARLATRLGPDGLPATDAEESRPVSVAGLAAVQLYIDAPKPPAWSTAKLPKSSDQKSAISGQ